MKESTERALDAISDTAAEWVLAMQDAAASNVQKAAFMEWLRQSPLHVREYLRAEVAFLALGTAARDCKAGVPELLRNAAPNVVQLDAAPAKAHIDSPEQGQPTNAAGAVPKLWALAATLLLVIGIALLGPSTLAWLDTDTYSTGTGEQRRVVLADGTAIDLNTQTTLRAHLTAHARDVELETGEAIFHVAKDPARPFKVTAGEQHVTALGTTFAIRQEAKKTTVTLIEGKIVVTPTDGAREGTGLFSGDTSQQAPLVLNPGQRVTFTVAAAKPKVDAPALEKVVAWRQHRLIFENETVANVVAEFNRYNTNRIVIEDPALAGERINGVFNAQKPQDLLDFLVRNTGAHVEEQADRVMVVK